MDLVGDKDNRNKRAINELRNEAYPYEAAVSRKSNLNKYARSYHPAPTKFAEDAHVIG